MSEEAPAIILDNGSGTMKIGLSNEDAPKPFFPSVVGTHNGKHCMVGSELEEYYIGEGALKKRYLLQLNYPIQAGVIQNQEDTLRLWEKAIAFQLEVDPKDHPLLLTETILNERSNREKLVQMAFESLQSPKLVICSTSLLCLYGCGLTTGLVVESGEGVTSTLPVFEGYPFYEYALKSNIAGRECTNYFGKLIQELGIELEGELVREIKEQVCSVELQNQANEENKQFDLPDGQSITLTNQHIRCTELMFKPFVAGITGIGLQYQITKSIDSCDYSIKKPLYENIILAGGNTLFTNFSERLKGEVQKLKPNAQVKITASPERQVLPWVGAYTLSQLQSFSQFWVTKEEYEEQGTNIVDKLFM